MWNMALWNQGGKKFIKEKRIKKMKIFLIILFCLIAIFLITIIIGRIINAQKYKIRSETGIQKTEYISIGGIEQYIQVRGQDVLNPVIIMLHGGPGNNMAYYSYYWQSYFEQDYTIVHWDQRGCGNTYYRNKESEPPTLDLLLSDLDELVDYICLEYGKEKVIIMGHSWGTFLGGIYSVRNPEKVSAYLGISQMVDFAISEHISTQEAIRLANEMGNIGEASKIQELYNLVQSYNDINTFDFMEFMKLRQLNSKYLPSGDSMSVMRMLSLYIFSPYMTFHEWRWFLTPMFHIDNMVEVNRELYDILFFDKEFSIYNYATHFEVPVIIVMGDSDWITPYSMAEDYFNTLSAPRKEFITIENTGHIPFLDKPDIFMEVLLETLIK